MLQKFACFLVGHLLCGAPVRPNMLNMPKSASDCSHCSVARGCSRCDVNANSDVGFPMVDTHRLTQIHS